MNVALLQYTAVTSILYRVFVVLGGCYCVRPYTLPMGFYWNADTISICNSNESDISRVPWQNTPQMNKRRGTHCRHYPVMECNFDSMSPQPSFFSFALSAEQQQKDTLCSISISSWNVVENVKTSRFESNNRIQMRFGSCVSFLAQISLKMATDNLIVGILWIVFLFYIICSCCKGIKVVHQGTFMIVEHFGKFSVGCVYCFETCVEDIETWNSLPHSDHREYTFRELEVYPGK